MQRQLRAAMVEARRRGGVVTADQLRAVGLTPDEVAGLLAGGAFLDVGGGALVAAGAPMSHAQHVRAAVVGAAGAGATVVISHRTAARRQGSTVVPQPHLPEVTVIGPSRNAKASAIVHRTDHLPAEDVRTLPSGLLITSPARTLFDLGAVVSAKVVERAFEEAVFRDVVTFDEVVEVLARCRGRGRRGCGVLATVLEERDPRHEPTESVLELQVLRFLRRCRLPPEHVQHTVLGPRGRPLRVDFAYPGRRAVEANSRRWHSGRDDVARNARKERELEAVGWSVFPITASDLRHARAETEADLRAFLGRDPRD